MKKLLILTIAVLFVMLPFSSFPKTVIKDGELDEVTAEEGVSVNFSNFSVKSTAAIGAQSWGDSDGGFTYSSPGFAGMNGVALSGNIASFDNGSMDIDVGTSGSDTRVNVTLPTTTLGSVNIDATMKISSAMDLSGGKELGRANMQGFSTQVKVDRIQVFAH
jgi:hypothetical protein